MPEQNIIRTIRIRGQAENIDPLIGKLGQLAKAQENVAIVSEQSARRQLSLEQQWKRQTLQLDENARMQNRIAMATKVADGALREGIITQEQHADRLNLITQRYSNVINATDRFTKSNGLARHELINLSRQAQDVGVSLASGQSPLTVLFQQGSQIADVFASSTGSVRGFATQAIGWLGRFATSAAGVVTGIGAIGAGALYMAGSWSEAQREIDKALIGIGRRSGVTAKDINEIARTSATATGLSVDEARGAALEFVKTGAIFRDNIKSAVAVTHDFALVTGKDARDAAKDLGAALASPLEGADALNAKIGFLDGRTREYIATLVSQNQKQEAQAVLLRNLAPAIQDATNSLGPFERAWNAVGNAAIGAKNAISSALTPNTTEQRRDALLGAINQVEAPRLEGTPISTRDLDKSKVAAMRLEVEALNETLRETARARALAFEGDKKVSFDADEAVRSLLPYIDQLKKVDELLAKIKTAQDSPGGKDRQGLGASNEAAIRSAEVIRMNLRAAAEEADRLNESGLRLAQAWGVGSIEVARTLDGLSRQLDVAQAVGAMAQIEAQHKSRIAELSQRLEQSEATRIADYERAISLAQIEVNHKQTMVALQGQLNVARQATVAGQINAQYQATIALLTPQVGLVKAIEQAEKQREISVAQVNTGLKQQLTALQEQSEVLRGATELEQARIKAAQEYKKVADLPGGDTLTASRVAALTISNARARQDARDMSVSWSVANDEAGKLRRNAEAVARDVAASATSAENMANHIERAARGAAFRLFGAFSGAGGATVDPYIEGKDAFNNFTTQFNPAGYTSTFQKMPEFKTIGSTAFGAGGIDQKTGLPTSEGINNLVNNIVGKQGGSITDAIDALLTGRTAGGMSLGPTALDSASLQMLQTLTGLLPQDQQAGVIEREIAMLRSQPQNIETLQAIAQLTQSLMSLKQSTDANTEALRITTDPLITQGHQYLNDLKIGYYHAANGLDLVARGPTTGDTIPFHAMVNGGERIQITPAGQSPVAANNNTQTDNSRNVQVHVAQTINIADTSMDRRTAKQRGQGFIGMAVRAATG